MTIREKMFYEALRIRIIEDKIAEIYPSDKIQSPVHLSTGQEHHIVALCNALKKSDQLYATYRSHAPYLAKGGDLKLMFAELYGKKSGISKGKAGSMHLCFPKAGFMGSSAIVGSIFPHALGAAYALKVKKRKGIAVALAGDGATEEGAFHESMNFASLKNLPLLFVIENNGLAIHSHIRQRQAYNIKDLSRAYKIGCLIIDDGFNMDFIYKKIKEIREKIVLSQRPFLVGIKTYRYKAHVGVEDDHEKSYRNKSEFKRWVSRDPLLINTRLIKKYKQKIENQISQAVRFAEEGSFPDAKELLEDVY